MTSTLSTTAKSPVSPLDMFYQWESQQGSRLAYIQPYPDGGVEELNWKHAGEQIRKMATYLRSLGLEPGSRIALMSSNCAHWIMADIAIWMAGYVSVPLYPTLTPDSIQKILSHSDAKVMFVGKLAGWEAMQVGVPDGVHCISFPLSQEEFRQRYTDWDQVMADCEPLADSPLRPLDDLATIIYTSGTTGMPKGVMHSFRNMAMVGTLSDAVYGVGLEDRLLSFLPLAHVAERALVQIGQLYSGFKVYFSDSLETFADDLRRARPTVFFAVPRIWTKLQQQVLQKIPEKELQKMLEAPETADLVRKEIVSALGMDCLRIGISGGSPISTSLMAWYRSLGIEILEVYGMTETLGYAVNTPSGESRIGYVGRANPGVSCKLSEQSEILVNSPTNMLGYYKDAELTSAAFDDEGFLLTGDKGAFDASGLLKITGRIKEIFKTSKGKYVSPSPIEDILLGNTCLEQVCVTGGGSLPQPIVLVNLSAQAVSLLDTGDTQSDLIANLEQLLEDTNAKLDKHENLACVVICSEAWTMENNLMTPSLKIRRPAIEERYLSQFESWCSGPDRVVFA